MGEKLTQRGVLNTLRCAAPDRTWCVTREDWYYGRIDRDGPVDRDFRVSVMPGYNGTECQQWNGKDLEAILFVVWRTHKAHVNEEVADPVTPPVVATSGDYAQACGDVADESDV